jgi:hypothetical protein
VTGWTIEVEISNRDGVADTYEITKQRPSSTTTNLFVDIASVVRDHFTLTPFTLANFQTGGVFTSRDYEMLSVLVTDEEVDSLGTNFTATETTYEALYGHGYYLEGQNYVPSSKTLLSHNNYKMDYRGYFLFPFRVVTGSEVLTVDGSPITKGTLTTDYDEFQYLVITGDDYTDDITIVYDGRTTLIERVTECKYDVKEIQFVNRYGMVETIHFYKVKKDTVKVESENFKNAYSNGVSYDTSRHQLKQFNKKSNKTFRMETGFLNEDYNLTVQELMESEHVWLREGGTVSPVNVTSNSLELKKGITDKVITYSLEFEYAFDEIANV